MENQNKRSPIFVDGYTTQDLADSVPEYILSKGSFKVDKLIAFLHANRGYAVNGWLNFTTKRSKEKGTRYTELDLYAYNKAMEKREEFPPEIITESSVDPYTGETIDLNSIPF